MPAVGQHRSDQPPASLMSAPQAVAWSSAVEIRSNVVPIPLQDLGTGTPAGYFAGKIKKPKNDQFAGDFEKNSLVAGLLLFGSSWRRSLFTAGDAQPVYT